MKLKSSLILCLIFLCASCDETSEKNNPTAFGQLELIRNEAYLDLSGFQWSKMSLSHEEDCNRYALSSRFNFQHGGTGVLQIYIENIHQIIDLKQRVRCQRSTRGQVMQFFKNGRSYSLLEGSMSFELDERTSENNLKINFVPTLIGERILDEERLEFNPIVYSGVEIEGQSDLYLNCNDREKKVDLEENLRCP